MSSSVGTNKQQEQLHKLNAALAELSSAIISPAATIDQVYRIVLDKSKSLTESQHGFVSTIESKTQAHISNTLTDMLREGCSVPASLYALPEKPHSLYHGLWGHALNTRTAFFTNSPGRHPAAKGLPQGHLALQNYLAVPIMFGGNLLGQIALANSPRGYSEEDLRMISRLGELYAIVLHNRNQENELRSSEERFRLMVETVPFPLVVTGLADQSVLYINHFAAELFQVPPQEAVGRKVSAYFALPEERLKIFVEIQKRGRVLDRELQLRDEQGRAFWVLLSATQVEWAGDPVIMAAINDITARKLIEEELNRLATTDSLTGIFNRRQFLSLGEQEISKAHRYRRPVSLIIYDVDHFKAVNDTYGHQTGDIVLKEITKAVNQQLRSSDIVGRIGGEEFAIILPETQISEALLVAERIRAAIENLLVEFNGITLHITASFGVTDQPENDCSLDKMFNRADGALYEAKERGRNCIRQK
ncbi:diguanylate cyclase [Desulfosporosinus sp. PR]|uniref:sensor domain-containing diguanylate cyclase n=1 Tax=Candidatus Desulfosporosinus nitrosoreducens TaxID=3401928 RepID=UPI0027F10905|nr:diguanylate cyclase [Desulfosporosinus sp. PR]MDQ7094615.1 diguanylate cyclase [Desulfosporosinus sp. PR]